MKAGRRKPSACSSSRCADLPFGFWPQLPWFRQLEGYAPYDALLREREARIVQLRGELLAIDPAGQVAITPGP